MKLDAHGHHPQHGDTVGKQRVGPADPGILVALALRVEMHRLSARVHAGIGTPGAHDTNRAIRDLRQGPLDEALHRRRVALSLPTAEPRSVVLEAGGESQGAARAISCSLDGRGIIPES